MENPGAVKLFETLREAFVVGGAVRNSVLGIPAADIDFATPLVPAEVARRLRIAGIGHEMVNAKFGITVAKIGAHRFEIATFRRDIYRRPRYPRVEFVKTAREDAPRRDFTMNALYMDARGNIFDFSCGLADIKVRIVRFIGPADESVRRDPLRILRYFRFCGEYFHENFDAEALAACRANIGSVRALPRKKIDEEMGKLGASPGLGEVLKAAPYMEEYL